MKSKEVLGLLKVTRPTLTKYVHNSKRKVSKIKEALEDVELWKGSKRRIE